MGNIHKHRPLEIACQNRFWQAFETLNVTMKDFAKETNLGRQKYVMMRQEWRQNLLSPNRYLDASALVWICTRHGVSPDWLLCGKGTMYDSQAQK